MISNAKPPTKAQRKRMDALRAFGCIACYKDGMPPWTRYAGICDVHHFTRNQKRRGHDWTIPLCDPHHVGNEMSWHKTRRKFREQYGEDEDLLAYTNWTILGVE